MKLDKRTRDALCAIAMGVLLGIIVFLLQRRFFNKEGYEGEEKPETAEEEAAEEPEEPEELVVESEDVGEAEIDEFDEELKMAQDAEMEEEDLELPTEEEMEEEIEEDATKEELITALSAALDEGSVKPAGRSDEFDEDEEEEEGVDSTGDKIAEMAQDALLGEIMKVATE